VIIRFGRQAIEWWRYGREVAGFLWFTLRPKALADKPTSGTLIPAMVRGFSTVYSALESTGGQADQWHPAGCFGFAPRPKALAAKPTSGTLRPHVGVPTRATREISPADGGKPKIVVW